MKAINMRDIAIRWLTGGAMVLLGAALVCAAEPAVQDFDGWKITITPGDFPIARGTKDHVPPSPVVAPTVSTSPQLFEVKLVSLRQNAKGEESDAPAPAERLTPAPTPTPDARELDLPVIVPGECCGREQTVAVDPPAGRVDPRYLSQMYSEVYRSIPFNRAEYNANPSYIHDSTMELLFGQMRPTVIHRNTTTVYHHHTGYAYPPVQAYIPSVGLRIHRTR